MPSFIQGLDNAAGKRKRESSGLDGRDERELDREREVQMKMLTAGHYTQPQTHNLFSASAPFSQRPMLQPRPQRNPGSAHKRRFLLSPKETVSFPGSPTHANNAFTSLHPSLDPFTTNSPLPNTASQPRTPSFNLPYTLTSLQENIRQINHDISQSQARSNSTSLNAQKAEGKVNLEACHICRRRPMQRKDLDCYADCEGCGRRCCWICVRQCLGPGGVWGEAVVVDGGDARRGDKAGEEDHEMGDGEEEYKMGVVEDGAAGVAWPAVGGHRTMVCSSCCVERGVDGEVRCLGCLRAEEAG